jgi:hypothetical protein
MGWGITFYSKGQGREELELGVTKNIRITKREKQAKKKVKRTLSDSNACS